MVDIGNGCGDGYGCGDVYGDGRGYGVRLSLTAAVGL